MKTPFRVLLINAINPVVEVEVRYPHLGLGYLVSYVRKFYSESEVIFKIIDQNIESEVNGYKPDLVGITCVTQNFNIAKKYIDYLYNEKITAILGGIHITSLPESLPDNILAACIGEGEITFLEIIKSCLSDFLTIEGIKKIDGLIYKENGTIKKTKPRAFMETMDNIPVPARDLFSVKPHTYMFTSRGCPYKCTFCASSRFWDTVRFFSADYVADEIELLVTQYNVKTISFFDDLFIANYKRLENLYLALLRKNLIGKVKFTCSCRANIVNENIANLLAKIGIVSVGLGLESGNNDILNYLKGAVNVEQNYKAIDFLKNKKIYVNASFVIGSPMETEEQIMDTYNFIKKSRLDLFDVYILTPYPCTNVWDYAEKKGLVSLDMDFSRLNVNAYQNFDDLIILSEMVSIERLKKIYKKFRRLRFFRNVIKVVNHPMRKDIPGMAVKLIWEYFNLIKKRMTKSKKSK